MINITQENNKISTTSLVTKNDGEDPSIIVEDSRHQKKTKKKNRNKVKADSDIAWESENNTKTTLQQNGEMIANEHPYCRWFTTQRAKDNKCRMINHIVEKKFHPRMKIKEAVQKMGKTERWQRKI